METRAMKRKIQKMQANPSMNPFEKISVPLVHDLISQHFSKEEVLDNLTVCKKWNRILSTSKVAMMKVRLVIDCSEFRSQRVQGLMKSHRTYRNISLYRGFDRYEDCSTVPKLISLLGRFSLSLVELKIFGVSDDCQLPQHIFPFPILESMKLDCCPLLRMIDGRFLKKLVVNVGDQDLEPLVDFLKQQLRLKELEINGRRSHIFKQKFPVDVLFALDSFTFNDYEDDKTQILESTENFHTFLLQMSPSLRHVAIRSPFLNDLKFVVNKMPLLKSLMLGAFKGASKESSLRHGLKPNTSITKLSILYTDKGIPKVLLASLPNLKDLYVIALYLTEEDFEWIVRNVKLVKFRLRGPWCRLGDIRVQYQRLKTEDSSINQDIEIV